MHFLSFIQNGENIMKFMSKAENLCAVGLIVFFFFPWISIGGFISIAGYEIPDIAKGLGQLAAMGSKTGKVDPQVYLYYLIYLIPIFSVLTIILGIADKSTKATGLIAGAVPIAALIYALSQTGSDTFEGMAIGAWLTLLTAIAMLLAVVGIIKMPAQATSSSS
jgi:hypothetical protein